MLKNLAAAVMIVTGAVLMVLFGPRLETGLGDPVSNIFLGALKGTIGGAIGGFLAWLLFGWRRKEKRL